MHIMRRVYTDTDKKNELDIKINIRIRSEAIFSSYFSLIKKKLMLIRSVFELLEFEKP